MSDIYRVNRTVSRLTSPYRSRLGGGLTDADREIMPFINESKEDFERDKRRKGLLAKVLDVLATGNYMSAGAIDALYDGVRQKKPVGETIKDTFLAAMRGLTHQEKNTFADVIRQNVEEYGDFMGQDEEFWSKPLFSPDTEDEAGRVERFVEALASSITPAGVAGFVGDVALDPLTYVNPLKAVSPMLGASTKARQAGAAFAEDALRLDILQKNLRSLKKMVGSEDVARQVKRMAEEGQDILPKVREIIETSGNVEFRQYLDDLMRKNIKKGTLTPAAELEDEMGQGVRALREGFGDKQVSALDELEARVAQGYEGAGTRSSRTLFGEGRIREAPPNRIAQTFQRMGELIEGAAKNVPVPEGMRRRRGVANLSEAWWAFMNRPGSPVGFLRKTFGVRNPYQKILRQKELDVQSYGHKVTQDLVPRFQDVYNSLDDSLRDEALRVRAMAETREFADWAQAKRIGEEVGQEIKPNIINTSEFIERSRTVLRDRFGLDDKQINNIKEFWEGMDNVLGDIREVEKGLNERGLLDGYEEIVNYLPKYQQQIFAKGKAGTLKGSQTPGFTQATSFSAEQTIQQATEQYKYFFRDAFQELADRQGKSLDNAIQAFITENDLAAVSLDLEEIFNKRIVAHARAVQRGKLIEEFRQFGIDTNALGIGEEISSRMAQTSFRQGTKRASGGIPSLGLYAVDQAGFKGYLFDKETADLLTKTFEVASSDEAMRQMAKLMANTTSLWKGWVTASSGFHMRNHFSNNFTGFMRHGAEWLNPKTNAEAWALSLYSLYPESYKKKIMEGLGVGEAWVNKLLNERVGQYTKRQLVDYAKEKGVVGWGTFFEDIEKKVVDPRRKRLRKAVSPFSQENVVLKGSRAVGNVMETKAKLQSFLLSVKQLTDGQLDEGIASISDDAIRNSSVLEWAKLDTKKYFLDYNDLTESERAIKKVVPFYAWLRKNVAVQLSGLVMFPQVYALASDVKEDFSIDGFPYVIQPDWQKDLGYMPIAQDEEGNYIMFFPNLPFQDLNKIPLEWDEGELFPRFAGGEDIRNELASMAHPALKRVVEWMSDTNVFRQREMLDEVDAPEIFQFPKALQFLDGAMQVIGFEDGLRLNIKDGKVQMDEQIERSLEAFLPQLRFIEKWVDLGLDMTGLDDVLEDAVGRKEDYEGLEDLLQKLSYFGGAKFKEFQEEWYRDQANREIEDRANELRSEYRRGLPGYDRRVREYLQKQSERRQRRGLY